MPAEYTDEQYPEPDLNISIDLSHMRGRPTATQHSVLSNNISMCKMDQSMHNDDLNVSAVMLGNDLDESHFRSQQNGSSFTKAMNNFDAKGCYNYGE
jgi:hypothetical protein